MAKVKTLEELKKLIEENTKKFDAKFHGTNNKRTLVICGGTGCLSSHSQEIKDELVRLIKEYHLEDKVEVNHSGCFGFCSQGPFIRIYPEETLYRMVKVEDCKEVVEKDLIGGEIVERLLYVIPGTDKKVVKKDDIPFYKKQVRIALHGCGTIDPENINEALGHGGFQGFIKA